MIFYMNSKVFQKYFLANESYKTILNTQYVIVSTKIKRQRRCDNIITANQELYPNYSVMSRLTEEDKRDAYYKQLKNSLGLLATIINYSIEEDYNIVFICTKNEDKLNYLEHLKEFIFLKFGYPSYEYSDYISGCKLIDYNKDKVRKKVDKILKDKKERQYKENLKSEEGRERIKKSFKNLSKKEMIKELKERNLYTENMDKRDMIEMLELFL